MSNGVKHRVLFVCMGNICRSPTAEGVFRNLIRKQGLDASIYLDSAGTHDYHTGKSPDPRAVDAAKRRGVDITDLRARQVSIEDFEIFDFILAMDHANYADLMRECPKVHRSRIKMFLDYARNHPEQEVPDPYFGGGQGFEHVLNLVEDASEGLLEALSACEAADTKA